MTIYRVTRIKLQTRLVEAEDESEAAAAAIDDEGWEAWEETQTRYTAAPIPT